MGDEEEAHIGVDENGMSPNVKPKRPQGGSPPRPVTSKRDALLVRDDVRNYIRNERDTDLKKIMALNETLKLEDRRRNDFLIRETKKKTREIPPQIERFLSSLKQACRLKVINKGGIPSSIIAQAFQYWDAQHTGVIVEEQLKASAASIGVRISSTDIRNVMQFYASPDGNGMTYRQLLEDIDSDEPTIIAELTVRKSDFMSSTDSTSQLIENNSRPVPQNIQYFIEALRNSLSNQMRDYGGTIESLLRQSFLMSDTNYSNGLDVEELIRCMNSRLGLTITRPQAVEVIRFYDTKGLGEIDYHALARDVTAGHPQFIHHPEISARAIQASYKSLSHNPFIPKAFTPIANKTAEKFKRKVKDVLEGKIKSRGGSMRSWIHETFVKYDPKFTGTITDWTALQGAMRRLGVAVSEDEARAVMATYEDSKGRVDYEAIVRDIVADEVNMLQTTPFVNTNTTNTATAAAGVDGSGSGPTPTLTSVGATARAPKEVASLVKKIRSAVNPFGRQSKGVINPRDVLHGTFVRFDRHRSGRVDASELKQILSELKVSAQDSQVLALIAWYDTNGSHKLDYMELTTQIFGDDPYLRLSKSSVLNLPKINTATNNISTLNGSQSVAVLPGGMSIKFSPVKDKFVKETKIQKEARAAFRRNQILNEKALIQQKLQEVEKQTKALMSRG